MSTSIDFIEFVIDQIENKVNIKYKKMFGEYMIYIDEKPILLVCDNIVYVKELECIINIIDQKNIGFPYHGAKEHFIIDVEDKDLLNRIIEELVKVVPRVMNKKR